MTPLDILLGCLVMTIPATVAYAQAKAGTGFWPSMAYTTGLPILALMVWAMSGDISPIIALGAPALFAACAATWKLGDHHDRIRQ